VIYLLLMSQEGRWARDADGNQWVLKVPRPGSTNFCMEHPTSDRLIPEGHPRWVSRVPGPGGLYGITERTACEACVDLQHPITEASA